MAKRLQLNNSFSPIGIETEVKGTYFTIQDFMEKQKDFLIYKRSKNLAPRSLYDYDRCFLYLNNYINEVYSDTTIRYDITLIRGYISYMLEKVSPNTVNIRICYLKVYLQFLESEGYVKELLIDYGKKAGLDKSSSAHKLRYTAITNLIKNGSNPLDVKSIAGHSNLEITMGYYLSLHLL